jgi:hypothetical protein
MKTLLVLLAIACILLGGLGWISGTVISKYDDRWSLVLLYIALSVALLPVFGHYQGTRDGGPRAITYMQEHPERYASQEIKRVQSALDHFTRAVPTWLLGLYVLSCFLTRWRTWAGAFLPAFAFIGYHVFHGELSNSLLKHGGADVLVTVVLDGKSMTWTFVLSAGIQIGLLAYVWTVSRHKRRADDEKAEAVT